MVTSGRVRLSIHYVVLSARLHTGIRHEVRLWGRKSNMVQCTKVCVSCGHEFASLSGASLLCNACRVRTCPQCGRAACHWHNGVVCTSCYRLSVYNVGNNSRKIKGAIRYAKDPEHYKLKSKLYRATHPDVIKASTVRYLRENGEDVRQRGRDARWVTRLAVIRAYGGKCECCGETEPKFLCIDHPNGNGKQDRDAGFGGVFLYRRLMREGYPRDGYRLLCHNCNEAFRLIGYCPHHPVVGAVC